MRRYFRRPPPGPLDNRCPVCLEPQERVLSAPNVASVVKVDNGVQAKAVEVNLELVEAIRDQATKDFSQKD